MSNEYRQKKRATRPRLDAFQVEILYICSFFFLIRKMSRFDSIIFSDIGKPNFLHLMSYQDLNNCGGKYPSKQIFERLLLVLTNRSA